MSALTDQREDQALGASFRRATAALPTGWHIRTQSGTFGGGAQCVAEAWHPMAEDVRAGYGRDLVEALDDLTADLAALDGLG